MRHTIVGTCKANKKDCVHLLCKFVYFLGRGLNIMSTIENHNNSDKNNIKKPSRSRLGKRVFRAVKTIFVIMLVLIFATIGIFGGSVLGVVKTTSLVTDDDLKLENFTSIVYDSKGSLVTKLTGDLNREWIDIKNVQPELQNAFIATEDRRFYKHSGVDYSGFFRAVVKKIKSPNVRAEGASTITMQLVKNLTNDKKDSLERKFKEQYRAIQLEKKLDKPKILELYLNVIALGHNTSGVRAAALKYFNKDLTKTKLTLAECACLSGITQNPTEYDPLTKKGLANNLSKQKNTLKIMLEEKLIIQSEYDKAIAEKVKFIDGSSNKKGSSQSYFVDAVIEQVIADCEKAGMSRQLAEASIYNKGWKIYTTLDTNIQSAMDKAFINEKNTRYFPTLGQTCPLSGDNGTAYGKKYDPQAAMVILDPKTGYVKGVYGARGVKTVDRSANFAVNTVSSGTGTRNNGSSFKPISVYAPAIETGLINTNSVVNEKTVYMDPSRPGVPYPTNYNNGKPRGKTTIRDAIKYSSNITAAMIWDKLNKESVYKFLSKSGIAKPPEESAYGVSVALGGTVHASPLQMAGAYSPFVNQGVYSEPILYTKVVKHDGTVLLDKTKGAAKQIKNNVYKPSTAYAMTNLLSSVVESGTAAGVVRISGANNEPIRSAGKTGTTEEEKDRWFVGFTPYYVGAVWFGDKNNYPMNVLNPSPADAIWNDVMNEVHKNLPAKQFERPSDYNPSSPASMRTEADDPSKPSSASNGANPNPNPDQPKPQQPDQPVQPIKPSIFVSPPISQPTKQPSTNPQDEEN